jgi:hypothetical protein
MKKLIKEDRERLPYSLIGIDGNAISIIGYVKRAMRENGYSNEALQTYQEEALSGNYDELLALSVAAIDKINRANGYDDETQFEKEYDNNFVDYSRGIYNKRANIIEESIDFDDDYKIALDDDLLLRTSTLLPISGHQRCLYIMSDDFESLDIDEDEFIDFIEQNINPIDIEGCVCNGDIQLIIHNEYKFNELLSKMKDELGISRIDIRPFIFTADEMKPIISRSISKRYKRY